MSLSNIARSTARSAVIARSCTSCHARNISTNPPPPPLGPEPVDKKGSAMPFIVGAVVASGGLGYYYMRQNKQERIPEVSQKTRELEGAARAQTQRKIDEGRTKIDDVKDSSKATYDSATNKANSAAADAQARLASYKDSATSSLQHARDSTEQSVHDAKTYVGQKGEEAKSSWWGWLGWGNSKSEEAKEAAARKAAQGAASVKQTAADAEKSASKRA
ncbi:hypothetical protein EW145_g6514 [Phellinidium pouzarii]|uniref:Uncharacterized protein n=1 Tax=Phellinidium pouzarii TaxID=167371 RepID=A0A4S4KXJ5_9AGAM|nr:hypothetical protein EW145_g6514 [Phellinidium pouzarii]